MANVINQARIKQRSLVVTLRDLKNAFGGVPHNLVSEILKCHHILDHMQQLILSLYLNFLTSILTNTFQTPFITVGRGVLQGGCSSPLTFKLCFNTFIQYISDKKFKQFSFTVSSLYHTHWFQYADDAVVITGLENENQILLNHFTRWCTWADMIIRVDKCSTFGIRKSSTQYLLKLTINHEIVQTADIGKSFRYLGRHFSYTMDNQTHMSDALEIFNDLMKKYMIFPVIQKINLELIINMFFPNFTGTLLLLISENLDDTKS